MCTRWFVVYMCRWVSMVFDGFLDCLSDTAMLTSLSSTFFFNDTATTDIYTLSLHDALPIYEIVSILAQTMSILSYINGCDLSILARLNP